MTIPRDAARRGAAILLCGPTASGKSALAVALAERVNGVVVNADSMQIYDALPILTARPDAAALSRAGHCLYGHVAAHRRRSVGDWLGEWMELSDDLQGTGKIPIIVGGSGLYFHALQGGLHMIPDVDPAIRRRLAGQSADLDKAALHRLLALCDPDLAASFDPQTTPRRRLLRGIEVHRGTGRPLSDWRRAEPLYRLDDHYAPVIRLRLEGARSELHRRAERRFDAMTAAGAGDELAAFLADLDPDRPPPAVLNALGAAQLRGWIEGRSSKEDAVRDAKTATRRYIKRQTSWFRRHAADWRRLGLERREQDIDDIVDRLKETDPNPRRSESRPPIRTPLSLNANPALNANPDAQTIAPRDGSDRREENAPDDNASPHRRDDSKGR